MRFYERYLLPWLIRWTMSSKEMAGERRKCLAGVRGKVLEVGFGNGLNLRHYPAGVESLDGLDPSPLAERLARKEIGRVPFPVRVHTGSGEAIPFSDGSFDSVVLTWTLCTIRDPAAALREIRRVLKPSGKLFFVEHGLSPQPRVARWQGRLNGIRKKIGGGCNLNRPMDRLITGAGFALESLDNHHIKGPKTHTYLYLGVAAPADPP